jgi:glycosyltransferase involved in cell wall biosynthesis
MKTLAFIWQGSSKPEVFSWWNDGLRQAMLLLEKKYEVHYKEPWDEITEDIVLYWEAPVTAVGKNGEFYNKIRNLPQKKILLFAGGAIRPEWVAGFDHICVESKINLLELQSMGFSVSTAFGINDSVFKPMNLEKKWDGIHHATSASWKRQWLMAEALGNKCLVVGREQPEDMWPFQRSKELGATVMGQHSFEEVAKLINQSHTLCQTSEFWGGGQRATLEAMACGVPPIVMTDSPKNMEYVEESGFGKIVEPSAPQIKLAVEELKANPPDPMIGVSYVKSKFTARHYADNLLKAINLICQKHQKDTGHTQ